MKPAALVLAALIALPATAAPVSAPGLTIVVPPGPAPTADQAKDCIAAHWIGARTAQNPASPAAAAERSATAAWVAWLSTTTGRSQTQLQPDVKLATDRLAVSLTDPAKADARSPILTRCAVFERETAPAAVVTLPVTTGEHDQQVEEGATPDDATLDDASASADAPADEAASPN